MTYSDCRFAGGVFAESAEGKTDDSGVFTVVQEVSPSEHPRAPIERERFEAIRPLLKRPTVIRYPLSLEMALLDFQCRFYDLRCIVTVIAFFTEDKASRDQFFNEARTAYAQANTAHFRIRRAG